MTDAEFHKSMSRIRSGIQDAVMREPSEVLIEDVMRAAELLGDALEAWASGRKAAAIIAAGGASEILLGGQR